MTKNKCGGIYNSGKCVLTREEGKKLGLNIPAKRAICVNMANEYGECNMELVPKEGGK